jgi:hypothetical protein
MKTFKDFYNDRLNSIKTSAAMNNMSMTKFLKSVHHQTRKEYRQFQLKRYQGKSCHSFWHRECVNKDRECYHCSYFHSTEDFDKMSNKERLQLGYEPHEKRRKKTKND